MNKQIGILAIIGIAALVLLSTQGQEKTHNLVTQEKAEAFTAFESWMQRHGKIYREDQVIIFLFRKNHTDLLNSLKIISL